MTDPHVGPPKRGFWELVGELGPKWITAIASALVALASAGFFALGHAAGSPQPAVTVTVTKIVQIAESANSASPDQSTAIASAAPSGTVYLTQLHPVQTAGYYAAQPVQMSGKRYQQSFVMGCGSTADFSMIYDVVGYKTLSATIGIPDDASGVSGVTANFTFTKNGPTDALGSPVSVEIGASQQVSINLDGTTQLSINCTASGAFNPIYVAVGNGALSTS